MSSHYEFCSLLYLYYQLLFIFIFILQVPSMGGLSYSEQMHVFADAHVLLAPHGAHMGNSLFFQSGAIVREVSCTGYSHFKKYPGLVKTLAINFRTVVRLQFLNLVPLLWSNTKMKYVLMTDCLTFCCISFDSIPLYTVL